MNPRPMWLGVSTCLLEVVRVRPATKRHGRIPVDARFCYPNVIQAIESVIIFQRDNGDCTNRKHARLRYTHGSVLDSISSKIWLRQQWASKFRISLSHLASLLTSTSFGWTRDETGLNHFTAFVENGRVMDAVGLCQNRLRRLLN